MTNSFLEIFEELNKLYESKEDQEKFLNGAGQNLADKFYKLKARLKGAEKDIYYWMKKTPKNLEDRLNELNNTYTKKEIKLNAQKGAKVLLNDNNGIILKITTPEAAQAYGKGTKGCITSTEKYKIPDELYGEAEEMLQDDGYDYYDYSQEEGDELVKDEVEAIFSPVEYDTMGEYYFYDYFNQNNNPNMDAFYYLLQKHGSHKYCYFEADDGEYLWDEADVSYNTFKDLLNTIMGDQRISELKEIPKTVIKQIPEMINNLGDIGTD